MTARASQPGVTVADCAALCDRLWPKDRAESWDNVGLLAGDPAALVCRCLCALDADQVSVAAAVAADAQLLIAHHPLPFRPLSRLVATEPAQAALLAAARAGVAVYAAHTNFDVHPAGTSRALADVLGLQGPQVLRVSGREALYKLVVIVPQDHATDLRRALDRAGAGRLGRYSACSFATAGTGRFRPEAGAHPAIGQPGELAEVAEERLEVLVPAASREAIVAAMRAVHPYEEPAYDLVQLDNGGPAYGLGMVGMFVRPMALAAFSAFVAGRLQAPATRFVGEGGRVVHRVAVCGGAGMVCAADALAADADVLVTADIRYHEARDAEARGLALVDPGHQATEVPGVAALADQLRAATRNMGWDVEVRVEPPRAEVWQRVAGDGRVQELGAWV